ncbi:hypothetical protein EC991_006315 [Linnemannia zychae]|nr:hypothetical protein EC991_006315 [Linnemannia zychae]
MKITAILSALAAASLVSAGKFHSTQPGKNNIVADSYIIQYQDGITARNAHDNLRKHAIDYKVRGEYDLFNGASIRVKSQHDGEALAAIPGIKHVWHVETFSLPKGETPKKANKTDIESNSLHHMTGVDVLHKKYKLTGKGVKVGIIDTGIDYKHPAFAAPGADEGCFARYGKNCRVKYGWDFVGDAYTGRNDPVADSDPMDCQGHGSHVAGIVGGNALNIKTGPKPVIPWVGVAPEVTFGAYRIFGCAGEADTGVILAAMEMAFNDGMDIINMSLGGGSAYKENPTAILGEKLIAHGMNLAGAAGNDGTDGVWMVSDTGLGETASSVASFDNAFGTYNTVNYAGAVHPYSPSEATGSTPISLPASATLVPLFDKAGVLQDGCDAAAYNGVDIKGKVVLLYGDFTRCGSVGRGNIAKAAGAAGALVQSVPFGLAGLVGSDAFPMASIENGAATAMIAAYKKNPKTAVTWSKAPVNLKVEGGGAPSGFSSFGVDGELRSKPDIGAPGGNILSSYPRAKGSYALLSGTSMATPYFAGSQALYYQAKKAKPSGVDVRRAFKNTATISKNFGSKTYASAAKQGAGLVNVLNAITATTSMSPDRIDLLDSVNFRKTQKITIKNTGKKTETYTLSHIPADALNSYATGNSWPAAEPKIEADYAGVSFSSKKVKIAAGKSVKVTVTFTEPKSGDAKQFPLYSGFVVATPSNEGSPAVHVPYIGLKGDVRNVPIIDKDSGIPIVSAKVNGKYNDETTPDFKYNFQTALPSVVVRYGSHTPDATIRVFDAKTKAFLGFVNSPNRGPAFGATGRMTNVDGDQNFNIARFDWRGQVLATEDINAKPVQLGAGSYNIVVASQKKFTKGAYPADFEIFDLGNINVV